MRTRPSTPWSLGGAGLALVAGAALIGCFSAKPDPTRFYVLTSETEVRPAESVPANELAIGVGPIVFPTYLGRTQIVTRLGPNQVELAEYDRWAEPLEDEFLHTLAENLSIELDTDRVRVHPWYGTRAVDYTVEARVLRFERDSIGDVQLLAAWAIRDGGTGARLHTAESNLRRASEGVGTEGSVAALSGLIADFGREVAAAIRRLGG